MPISLFTGLPRSGKSYSVVSRVIVPALKAGRTVITNIPLTEDSLALGRVIQLDKDKRDMSQIADMLFCDEECTQATELAGSVFVIDEFSLFMPAGVRQSNISNKIKMFFAMHGHTASLGFATEIVLITQSYTQINAYVVSLIQNTYHAEKKDIGFSKSYNLKIFQGAGRSAQLLRTERHFYDKELFKYYKSQTLNDDSNADETQIDNAGSLFKLPALKWGLIVIFVILPILVWQAIESFGDITSTPNSNSVPASNSVPNSNSVPASNSALKPSSNNILSSFKVYLSSDIKTSRYHRVVFILRSEGGGDIRMTADDLRVLGYRVQPVGDSYLLMGGDYRQLVPTLPDAAPVDLHPVSSGVASAVD